MANVRSHFSPYSAFMEQLNPLDATLESILMYNDMTYALTEEWCERVAGYIGEDHRYIPQDTLNMLIVYVQRIVHQIGYGSVPPHSGLDNIATFDAQTRTFVETHDASNDLVPFLVRNLEMVELSQGSLETIDYQFQINDLDWDNPSQD